MNFDPTVNEEIDGMELPEKLSQPIKEATDQISYMTRLIEEKLGIDETREKNVISYSGLPYMLDKSYFHDAFILHEESDATKEFNEAFIKLVQELEGGDNEKESMLKYLKKRRNMARKIERQSPILPDNRSQLRDNWAQMKNILRFQVQLLYSS